MFSKADVNSLDIGYFELLGTSPYAITLRSRCTGHEWHILHTQGEGWQSCRIYHRHHHYDIWHFHGGKSTLEQAINAIVVHDAYQQRKMQLRFNGGRRTDREE